MAVDGTNDAIYRVQFYFAFASRINLKLVFSLTRINSLDSLDSGCFGTKVYTRNKRRRPRKCTCGTNDCESLCIYIPGEQKSEKKEK